MKSRYIKKRLSNNSTRDEHRLIMELHLGRRLSHFEVVHHIDGNGRNNDISNLQLMTRATHAQLHYKPIPCHDHDRRGEANSFAKLTDKTVKQIKIALKEGISTKILSRIYRVGKSTIFDIRSGRTWSHIL